MRDVPMSQKLGSILDMRRHAPDGKEHAANTYVSGNEVLSPKSSTIQITPAKSTVRSSSATPRSRG